MKVAINCRSFLLPEYAGIGRYAQHLVRNLAKIDHENDYLLYVRKNFFARRRRAPKGVGTNFHVRLDQFDRGIDSIVGDADIYHSPSPDYLNTIHRRLVVTVHDMSHLTYPQSHTKTTIDLMNEYFVHIIDKASKIICCSQNTRDDLHRYFDIDPERTCMVYHGVDHQIFYQINDVERVQAIDYFKLKNLSIPFILFVGTIQPRKNLVNLLKAFHQIKKKNKYDGKLVVAGMHGWMSDEIAPLMQSLDIVNDVHFLGFVSDQELRWLYNLCDLFTFPSFYEGFGFPILEAFCCGAPVIASGTSSGSEIVADAARIIDPHQYEDIACAMGELLNDDNKRDHYRQKGLKRAQEFSFKKNAIETQEIYKQVFQM